jgi:DHA1 family bicyclomycin/chloramphenicol resistance-like MFS transporter
VQLALGWRAVFTTMALAGALLAWMVARRLPETLPRAQRVKAHPLHIAASIARVCRHREFLLLATGSSLVWLAPQLWMGAAPAVILDHWHGTETSFALLTFPVIVGYMLGALISGRLAGHWPPGRQAVAGYVLLSCGVSLMLLLQLLVPGLPVLAQQALLALTTLGLQMLYPVVMLRVIDLFPGTRGAAASALSGFTIMASALGMGLASPWLSVSLPRLSAGACACVATSLALWWPLRPRGAGGAGGAAAVAVMPVE